MSRFVFLLCCLLTAFCAIAQEDYRIGTVQFEGVEKNNLEYLYLFVQSKKGAILDQEILNKDLDLLNRRAGIAKTNLRLDTVPENLVNVTYHIEEQRTLIPQFGIGGIKKNIWWQLGFAEFNLGGKGQTIIATYLHHDGRPNGKVFYENDWLKGTPWGFGGVVNYSASVEPLYFPEATVQYKYSNSGAGIFGSYNLGFNHKILVGTNFFKEQYEKKNINLNEMTPGPNELVQDKWLFKANFETNKLGYDYFYRTGVQWNLLGQAVLTLKDDTPFFSLRFEGKKFWRPYETGNIAMRIRAAIASNSPTPFAPFVVDSRVNIRGVGNRVDRGTAQFVVNLELRQTIFHKVRFAAQVVAFADSGTWRNPGGDFSDLLDKDLFRQFVGIGVRIIDKKVFRSIFRFDYGFDIWNRHHSGPVLGIGQYF